jgi:hypothetical protein
MNEFFQEPQMPEIALQYNRREKDNSQDKEDTKYQNKIHEYEITKQLYQNTRGVNTPKSYMVVLDSKVISVANNFVYNKVVFELCDPIIIDSPTDIYLEFLHFQNTDISEADGTSLKGNVEQTSQYYIDIEEFSINNISNNQFQSSKFFIPNEVYGKTDYNQNDGTTNVRTTYIKQKSNYLCRIESNYIKKLTVTIQAEKNNGGDGSSDTIFGFVCNRTKEANNFNTTSAVKIGLYFDKK